MVANASLMRRRALRSFWFHVWPLLAPPRPLPLSLPVPTLCAPVQTPLLAMIAAVVEASRLAAMADSLPEEMADNLLEETVANLLAEVVDSHPEATAAAAEVAVVVITAAVVTSLNRLDLPLWHQEAVLGLRSALLRLFSAPHV